LFIIYIKKENKTKNKKKENKTKNKKKENKTKKKKTKKKKTNFFFDQNKNKK